MVSCWDEDPQSRPKFREIVDVSTDLLKKMGGVRPTPHGSRRLIVSQLVSCIRRVESSRERLDLVEMCRRALRATPHAERCIFLAF